MLMVSANDILLHVNRIKEMDVKEAAVGQRRQALCDLGKFSKSLWRETPSWHGALAKASTRVWRQKGKMVIDLVEIDLSVLVHRKKHSRRQGEKKSLLLFEVY